MYTYVREQNTAEGLEMVDESTEQIKSFDHNSIYRSPEYTKIMNEYFDIYDTRTRNILLAVNEADQDGVMKSLADKLYSHIVEKVDDIDFGTIPLSKGDITKIDNYDELMDCINIMGEILVNYHQDTKPIDTIRIAVNNISDRTDLFVKAYRLNVEMPIVFYNTIVLSIVSAVSFMIASCIDFITSSGNDGFEISINNTAAIKTKDCVLFKDLEKFNNTCTNGQFDKSMDFIMNGNANNFMGAPITMAGVGMGIGVLISIIPIMRELIFFFYYSRARVSEYFDIQSSLLTMNAYNIENNLTRDVKNKKTVAAKQKKIADQFKRISNAFKVKVKTSEKKAEKESEKIDKEKYKASDIMDSVPDSANSVLF